MPDDTSESPTVSQGSRKTHDATLTESHQKNAIWIDVVRARQFTHERQDQLWAALGLIVIHNVPGCEGNSR